MGDTLDQPLRQDSTEGRNEDFPVLTGLVILCVILLFLVLVAVVVIRFEETLRKICCRRCTGQKQLDPERGFRFQRRPTSFHECSSEAAPLMKDEGTTDVLQPTSSHLEQHSSPEQPLDSKRPLVTHHYGHVQVAGGTNVSIGGAVTNITIFPEVDKKLTSYIQAIEGRTASRIEAQTKGLIKPKIVDDILKRVSNGQTWITIMGGPGEGKSAVAYLVLRELLRKGRQVLQVTSPEEFTEVTSTYTKPVILLNKIFGDFMYKSEEAWRWKDVLSKFLDEIWHKVYDPRRQAKQEGITVLLVEHAIFLHSACHFLGNLSEFITETSQVVKIVFDFSDRMQLVKAIIGANGIVVNESTLHHVCTKYDIIAFTAACRLFVTLYKDNPSLSMEAFFESREEILNATIDRVLSDVPTRNLFKEIIKLGGKISDEQLQATDKGSTHLHNLAENLVGRYLRRDSNYFMFHNLSIYKSVEYSICKQFTTFVIEKCPLSLIFKRFSLNESNDSSVIPLSKGQSQKLAKRFAVELVNNNLLLVLSHSACTFEWFIEEMMQTCTLTLDQLFECKDHNSNDTFLILVSSNKSPQLLQYIDKETDLFKTDTIENKNKLTNVLFGVCRYGATEVFNYLKKRCYSLDVNAKHSDKKQSALMIAAETKSGKLVQEIISLKPELGARDIEGATALHYLCHNGLLSEAAQAIDQGADVDATDNLGLSPVHYAGRNNQVETVKMILDRVKKMDAKLVQLSCEEGHIDVVKLLYDRGLDVEMELGFGYTPLLATCQGGNVQVINFLIENGASITSANGLTPSPLHIACYHNKPQAVKCLVQHTCDLLRVDASGETPLHKAVMGVARECLDLLVTLEADVNAQNFSGDTPLHKATERDSKQCFYALINANAKVNIHNNDGFTPLHMAVAGRSKEFVHALLVAGASVNDKNENGCTPLHIGAKHGSKACVEELLRARADVSVANSTGTTPLHNASEGGFDECMSMLIKSGADVNATDNSNNAPLHKAAENVSKDCVDLLLKRGAKSMSKNIFGKTSLHLAVEMNSSECVELILKAGADASEKTTNGLSLLHIAAEKGSPECINLLLKAGTGVNVTCGNKTTPLHKAAKNGFEKCLQILVNAKADVNFKNMYGQTSLHKAAESGWKECVRLLIDNGAEINETTDNIHTPLHKAAISKSVSCVNLLLEEGADCNLKDKFGCVPLHLAAAAGSEECVQILLEKVKNANPQSKYRETPLHKAAENGFEKCVDLLLSKGADVNIRTYTENTPLHKAAEKGSSECIKSLLQASPDFNTQNDEGYTPLLKAVVSQSESCVDVLLGAGADVNKQNDSGLTALHLAATMESNAILKKLLKAATNVSAQDRLGNTPLHEAAEHGTVDCLNILLKNRADLNIQNKRGLIPLHKAIVAGSIDCTDRLLEAGTNTNIKTFAGKTASDMIRERTLSDHEFGQLSSFNY